MIVTNVHLPTIRSCASCGWDHDGLNAEVSSSGIRFTCPMTDDKVYLDGRVLKSKHRNGKLITPEELINMNESSDRSNYIDNVLHQRYNNNKGDELNDTQYGRTEVRNATTESQAPAGDDGDDESGINFPPTV